MIQCYFEVVIKDSKAKPKLMNLIKMPNVYFPNQGINNMAIVVFKGLLRTPLNK